MRFLGRIISDIAWTTALVVTIAFVEAAVLAALATIAFAAGMIIAYL